MVDTPLVDGTADLALRLGEEFTVSEAVMLAAIADVSVLARAEAGDVGETWDAASGSTVPVPARVRVVVLDAARRRITNPDNLISETSGDVSYRRFDSTDTTEVFYKNELEMLRSYRGTVRGLGSIRMERDGLREAAESGGFVETNMPGDPIPWPTEVGW